MRNFVKKTSLICLVKTGRTRGHWRTLSVQPAFYQFQLFISLLELYLFPYISLKIQSKYLDVCHKVVPAGSNINSHLQEAWWRHSRLRSRSCGPCAEPSSPSRTWCLIKCIPAGRKQNRRGIRSRSTGCCEIPQTRKASFHHDFLNMAYLPLSFYQQLNEGNALNSVCFVPMTIY